MIFSLFKKPRAEDKVPEAKMVKVPPPTGAGPAAPTGPQSRPPAAGEAPIDELEPSASSLDFTDLSLTGLENEGIQLEGEDDPLQSVVEQAAVLYAHGQDPAARVTLEDAARQYRSGSTAERLWLMLLDYYQIKGEKDAFEALELDFARTFEKSPPAWHEPAKAQAKAVGGIPTAMFKGAMEGNNDAAFGILADTLEKSPRVRLDLSKIQGLDNAGAARFLQLLQDMHKRKKVVELAGSTGLEDTLAEAIAPGRQENPDCWLLLLELLLRAGRQEEFEEKAVDYAVTFEVSPPSWDASRVQATPSGEAAACAKDGDLGGNGNAYCLQGEVKNARFIDLKDFAADRDPLVIDCSNATRIDFVSAGALVNVLTPLKRQNKMVLIRNTNRLVAELLKVVGVDAVARIDTQHR